MAESRTVDIAEIVETQERGAFPAMLFVMCCLVMLVDGFNQQSLNYAAPAIIKDWGIAKSLMTPVFDINIFGWMLGSIAFSMLADSIGRRNSIILAVAIFGVFTIALSYASNLVELSVIRFFSALGVGGAMPMAISMMADYSQARSRGLKITLLYLGYTTGSSGGGFLASWLTPNYGWHSIFYVGGIVSLVIGAILFFGLPESVRYLVLKQAPTDRILPLVRRLKPSTAYDANTQFVIRETAKKGVPVKHLFTEGRTAMTIFLWFALGFSFVTHFFMSAWLSTLFSEYSHQMDIPQAQRTAALFQMGAGFSFFVGWLLDKRGLPVITTIMLAGALPVAALGLIGGASDGLTMALALASGILVLGGNIGLNAVSGMIYPTFIRSTGTGAAFAAARIGALIGPLLAGLLIEMQVPMEMIFIMGALPMLAAGAATFMLEKTMTPAAMQEMSSRSALARH